MVTRYEILQNISKEQMSIHPINIFFAFIILTLKSEHKANILDNFLLLNEVNTAYCNDPNTRVSKLFVSCGPDPGIIICDFNFHVSNISTDSAG